MKKVNCIVLVAVAVYLLNAQLALSQGNTQSEKSTEVNSAKQEVNALVDQAVYASLRGDSGFLEKYYADDAMIIHSDGKLVTKAQEIANAKSGNLKYDTIDVSERNTWVHGERRCNGSTVVGKGHAWRKAYHW